MSAVPVRDVALCVELRERAIRALMTRDDWAQLVDRVLLAPRGER